MRNIKISIDFHRHTKILSYFVVVHEIDYFGKVIEISNFVYNHGNL